MVICGIGAGFINVPLASTAVAVVEPARAGLVRPDLPRADLHAILLAQELVEREPQCVHDPREHRQRRHVRALLDRRQIRHRDPRLVGDLGERAAERDAPVAQPGADAPSEGVPAAARR
jgi:hypothetical protein